MIITKYYWSSKEATRYQNSLYERYHYVRLIRSPTFSEGGTYAWEVKSEEEVASEHTDK